MSFKAVRGNKILAKIFELTVFVNIWLVPCVAVLENAKHTIMHMVKSGLRVCLSTLIFTSHLVVS